MDDAFAVLSTLAQDKFVDVKLCSAAGVAVLQERGSLHLGAQGLVTPTVKNLPHQQRKVRAASVKALGE